MPLPKFVGLDIETSGLHPVKGKDKIFCVAITDGKTAHVHESIERVRALCENENVCKVIHNAAFDGYWLKALYNIELRNVWDTKLMEQVLIGDNLWKEESKCTEEELLELSSSLYWTLKRYKLPAHDKSMSVDFSKRPINAPLTKQEIEYVKKDVQWLLHIQALQEVRLAKLDLTRVAALENRVVEVVIRMKHEGIGIDVDYWLEIEKENNKKANDILKRMPNQVSNWNSPAQVKKYFTSKGIPVNSLSDITDDFVKKYNDPILNKFVEMRKLTTNSSKYGKNFLYDKEGRYLVDPDGRIRADFFQILNTGRFSCSRPPLHGLPREGKQRSAFKAKPGYVFVAGDFSGQEVGIMAAASGERLWIDALLRGDDPLSLMASMIFKDWAESTEKGCVFPKKCKCKKHKVYRQDAKTITYGIAYGAYPGTISEKINRTKNETQKLIYRFSVAAPKLHRWLNKNAKETILTRISYSADVYRRRRTIRDPQEWMVRNVGYNNPVQSSGANMMKLAMISLNRKWKQIMPWHDDLILEVKKSEASMAIKELKTVMEKAADYCTGIPGLIKVEPRITKSLHKDD
jgi:DNA polymerase I-like protein with 3'-5' exonuclease and polymerase domains